MLLTLFAQHQPASDLGYLYHKHPQKVQEFDLRKGKATVFYPHQSETEISLCLLVEADPVGLVRSNSNDTFALRQYVNDRPYVASSLMSSALSQVLRNAMNGSCKDRPDLVDHPFELRAELSALPAPGPSLIHELFEPLGYTVETASVPLDSNWPEWGDAKYFRVVISGKCRVQDLLTHLYVLIPVLDNDKHYFVSDGEVEKLLEKGGEWLKKHPKMELITRRYLRHRKSLTNAALERLTEGNGWEEEEEKTHQLEDALEEKLTLHQVRLNQVMEKIRETGAKSVLDLGCGEGKLLRLLLKEKGIEKILGMDVSYRSLEMAKRKLYWENMSPRQKERIDLIHGALTYRDRRLEGFDAAALVEVIEHLDPPRLEALEKVVFQHARPGNVVITTVNQEYNVLFESLAPGKFRHGDHRFEWTRAQFEDWAEKVAGNHKYKVSFFPVGPVHEQHGAPSQMAFFEMLD
ncbi:MAG: 3' terminal RNA ribose 2'-O-methyltransferase Hen1 [Bacteroidia bacterium]|nr:3' terminal RNA ribose 2'-O-methyltransferase Hen1 [Bacteroidia bacterium]